VPPLIGGKSRPMSRRITYLGDFEPFQPSPPAEHSQPTSRDHYTMRHPNQLQQQQQAHNSSNNTKKNENTTPRQQHSKLGGSSPFNGHYARTTHGPVQNPWDVNMGQRWRGLPYRLGRRSRHRREVPTDLGKSPLHMHLRLTLLWYASADSQVSLRKPISTSAGDRADWNEQKRFRYLPAVGRIPVHRGSPPPPTTPARVVLS
jgi:hypothetical protein